LHGEVRGVGLRFANPTYRAAARDAAMHGHKTGKGQVYLAAHKDEDGDWSVPYSMLSSSVSGGRRTGQRG